MRNTKIISFIILFTALFFFACSSEDSGSGPDLGTTDPTSITLTSTKTTFDLGEKVTFTVKTNQGTNVTTTAKLKVNGNAISGNSFSPTEVGILKIKATFSNLTSNELSITVNDVISVTSVVITSDINTIAAGKIVTFTTIATLSDGSNVDKTEESEYYVNNVKISGHKYIGSKLGEIKVKSSYNSVTSPEIPIQVDQINTPASFTKKAVIEDFTGTWCGWCPRVSHAIDLVHTKTDKVFFVGIHTGDPMENNYSKSLTEEFGINSFPSANIDRKNEWVYPEPTHVNQAIGFAEGNVVLGTSINSTLNGNTIDIVVSNGFTTNLSDLKLVVFLLEDALKFDQTNYTSYFNGNSTLVDFEHNHVLRYAATNILGDATNSSTGVHHNAFSVKLSDSGISDPEQVGILTMLVGTTGKVLYNVQYAKLNESKDFD